MRIAVEEPARLASRRHSWSKALRVLGVGTRGGAAIGDPECGAVADSRPAPGPTPAFQKRRGPTRPGGEVPATPPRGTDHGRRRRQSRQPSRRGARARGRRRTQAASTSIRPSAQTCPGQSEEIEERLRGRIATLDAREELSPGRGCPRCTAAGRFPHRSESARTGIMPVMHARAAVSWKKGRHLLPFECRRAVTSAADITRIRLVAGAMTRIPSATTGTREFPDRSRAPDR